MSKIIKILTFIFISSNLHAFLVSNPASPCLFTKGIFSTNQTLSLRSGYFYNNTYRMLHEDEILSKAVIDEDESTSNYLKIKSQGGSITLNIQNKWDLYTYLGSSILNIGDELTAQGNQDFCWAAGCKLMLLKIKLLDLGLDAKYFRTKQKMNHFISEKLVYPILTPNFSFLYEEYQVALAASCKLNMFVPYVGGTYLYSIATPYPGNRIVFRYPVPYEKMLNDLILRKSKNKKKWGIVAGISIISQDKININLETRLIDQNNINITTELRF